MTEFLVLIILLGFAWFWLENHGVRDQAILIAKDFCAKENVQFLDGAMASVSIRLRRDAQGRLAIARTYQFEFSDTGDNRLKGTIIMLGKKLETLHLQPYRLSVVSNQTLH
jgi:Protein of unknown function (DUF3301)